MSYSGGDGQALGILLTPRHTTDLFCNLFDLKPDDKVMDMTLSKTIQRSTLYITQSA